MVGEGGDSDESTPDPRFVQEQVGRPAHGDHLGRRGHERGPRLPCFVFVFMTRGGRADAGVIDRVEPAHPRGRSAFSDRDIITRSVTSQPIRRSTAFNRSSCSPKEARSCRSSSVTSLWIAKAVHDKPGKSRKPTEIGVVHGRKSNYVLNIDENAGRGTAYLRGEPKVRRFKIIKVEFVGAQAFPKKVGIFNKPVYHPSRKGLNKVIKTRRHWMLSWITGSGVLKDENSKRTAELADFNRDQWLYDSSLKEVQTLNPTSPHHWSCASDFTRQPITKVGSVKFTETKFFSTSRYRRTCRLPQFSREAKPDWGRAIMEALQYDRERCGDDLHSPVYRG